MKLLLQTIQKFLVKSFLVFDLNSLLNISL